MKTERRKRYAQAGMEMLLDAMVQGKHIAAWRYEDGDVFAIRTPDTRTILGETFHFPGEWLREEMVKADPLNAGDDLNQGYAHLLLSGRVTELFTLLARVHDEQIGVI